MISNANPNAGSNLRRCPYGYLEAGYVPTRNDPRNPWFRICVRFKPRVPFILEPHWQGAQSECARTAMLAYVRQRERELGCGNAASQRLVTPSAA
jgi:hypothetical protein